MRGAVLHFLLSGFLRTSIRNWHKQSRASAVDEGLTENIINDETTIIFVDDVCNSLCDNGAKHEST